MSAAAPATDPQPATIGVIGIDNPGPSYELLSLDLNHGGSLPSAAASARAMAMSKAKVNQARVRGVILASGTLRRSTQGRDRSPGHRYTARIHPVQVIVLTRRFRAFVQGPRTQVRSRPSRKGRADDRAQSLGGGALSEIRRQVVEPSGISGPWLSGLKIDEGIDRVAPPLRP